MNKLVQGVNDLYTWCLENNKQELIDEWDKEKNLKELGHSLETVSRASKVQVHWKCKKGHEWQVKVNSRTTRNFGCPVCSNKKIVRGVNDLATWCKENNRQNLLDEWDRERNLKELGITPESIARGSNRVVNWICKEEHEWKAMVYDRAIRCSGCPQCKRTSTSYPEQFIFAYLKQIFTQALNREKAFGYEFDIAIPEKRAVIEYQGYYYHLDTEERDQEKVELCKTYKVQFIRVVENRDLWVDQIIINEDNIEYSGKIVGSTRDEVLKLICKCILKMLNEEESKYSVNIPEVIEEARKYIRHCRPEKSVGLKYPELLNEWDYEKNGDIDPLKTSYGSVQKVAWVCSKNTEHKWSADINSRVRGSGCPGCAGRLKVNDIGTLYPELYKELDIENNIGRDIRSITAYERARVDWCCIKCGHKWSTKPGDRVTYKSGCPHCGYNWHLGKVKGRNGIKANSISIKTAYPELYKEMNIKLNQGVDIQTLVTGSCKRILWNCIKCGHIWTAKIKNRVTYKSGCKRCGYNWYLGGVRDRNTAK